MGHGSWALQNTQRRYLPIAEMCVPSKEISKKFAAANVCLTM
jgi:hypothetical protein